MGVARPQADRHERRVVTRDFSAFTLRLDKHVIREGSILDDFRVGPGHEGLRPHDHNVVSFHYDGQVYFNLVQEVERKTRIVKAERLDAVGHQVNPVV
jgi:hypothetical protein